MASLNRAPRLSGLTAGSGAVPRTSLHPLGVITMRLCDDTRMRLPRTVTQRYVVRARPSLNELPTSSMATRPVALPMRGASDSRWIRSAMPSADSGLRSWSLSLARRKRSSRPCGSSMPPIPGSWRMAPRSPVTAGPGPAPAIWRTSAWVT